MSNVCFNHAGSRLWCHTANYIKVQLIYCCPNRFLHEFTSIKWIPVAVTYMYIITVPVATYPSPRARMCEMSKEGIRTLRNSAEKIPPFFMTPLFLILRDTERRGCLKWNSLTGVSNQTVSPSVLRCSCPYDDDQYKRFYFYFGGMFSGLLDQSTTQSASLFSGASSSREGSGLLSPDWKHLRSAAI